MVNAMDICVPRCDICQLLGEEGGLKALCTCKVCGVLVHRECYGLRDDDEEVAINFVCRACKEANEEELPFDRMDSRAVDLFRAGILEKRPLECALCSVKRGFHAMHPLYDNHGPSGQQIVLDNPTRPAWVHTMCALVGTKFGYVYGCCPDGLYQYSDSRRDDTTSMEDIDDRAAPNPKIITSDSSDNSLVHHFSAYCLDRGGINAEYTERMKEHKALKCMFCKSDDAESYRIAIQCSAGNVPKDVYSDFSATRDWKLTNDYCSDSLHVGCAAWMTVDGKQRTPRRIFFFPGTGRENQERKPIAEVYCSFHAHAIEKCRCSNLRARYGLNRNLPGSPQCSESVACIRSTRELCAPVDLNKKLPASPEKNDCMNAFGRAGDETSLHSRAMYEARRNASWANKQEALKITHHLEPEPVDDMDIKIEYMHSLPVATATKHRGNGFVHVPNQRQNAKVNSHGPVFAASNNQRALARMARGRSLVPTHMEKQNNDYFGANMLQRDPRQRPSNSNRHARTKIQPNNNRILNYKENAFHRRKSYSGYPAIGRHNSMTNGRALNADRQHSMTSALRQPKVQCRRKKTAAQVLNKDEAVPPNRKAMERYEEIAASLKADLLQAHPEQAKTVMIDHKKRWIRRLVRTCHCTMKTFDDLWHLVCEEMAAADLL